MLGARTYCPANKFVVLSTVYIMALIASGGIVNLQTVSTKYSCGAFCA